MVAPLYRGYSSTQNTGVQTETFDIDLIKADLLNHFNTRLDERVGRPRWGAVIHDLLFDLSDDRTEALVVADAERIINSDPRVQLLEIVPRIDLDNHEISLTITVRAVEFDMEDQFDVTFREDR